MRFFFQEHYNVRGFRSENCGCETEEVEASRMCDQCGLKRSRTRESWLTDRCRVLRCRTTLTPMRSRCQTHNSDISLIPGCQIQRNARHNGH